MALLLVLPTLVLQAATVSSAGADVTAGFEIDGNVVDDAVGGVDWNTPVGTRTTDPTGNADGSNFTGGSKEFQNPEDWKEGTGTSTNQGDISDVYSHFATGDESWAFLGFRRIAQSGTMTFMVEFNQKDNLPMETGDSVPFRPNRTVNDLLLRFEQDGNGNFDLTAAYKWTQSPGGSFPNTCFTVPGYAVPSAYCPTDLTGSGFDGATGEDKLFAEGAVNLSAFDEIGDCRGAYGVMNVRSFAGDSETSSLLDFIGGVGINVPPTCGSLVINKVDQFGDPVGGATFKITPDPTPGSNAASLTVVDGGAGDSDGTADGTVTISPAKPGLYTVIETATPDGYVLDTTVHSNVEVGDSGTSVATVEFENKLKFKPLQVTNQPTATFDVDHDWKVLKSVDRDRADIPEGGSAAFEYTVTLRAVGRTVSGRELGGTVTVTNPNTHGMVATLSTQVTGGVACTFPGVADVSGAPGLQVDLSAGAHDFTYTCAPAPAGNGQTEATVSWDPTTYPGDPAGTYSRTDAKAYTYVADVVTDASTTVTDTFDGGSAEVLGTVDWDPAWNNGPFPITAKTWTYTRNLAGTPGKCTDHPNTAKESADGTSADQTVRVCVGRNLDVTKDARLGFQRELLWDIAKSGPGTVWVGDDLSKTVDFTIDVTADGMTDSAWALTGTILVDNPNDWPVTVDVTDTVVVDTHDLTCTIDGGSEVVVPANAVDHPVTYDCPGVQQGDYVGTNTVTIDWSGDSHAYPKTSDSATVDVEVTGDDEPTNATVTLTDLLAGEDVTADLPQTTFDWATVNAMPGHTQSLTYSVELDTTADACTTYTNVVSIDQVPGAKDSAKAVICSPGVAKTVDADFGQKQLWSLTKDVDKTFVEVGPDGEATFNYTVTATPGAVVPNGEASWTGTVSVHNPSTDAALTVDVSDVPAVAGWTCELVDDATGVQVAPGATETLDYTCTGSGHAGGTNTATATFAGGEEVSTTVDVEFEPLPDVVDSTTTLTDDIPNDGLPAKELAVDAAKGANVFTYSRTLGAPAGACETYTNTAVLVLTGDDLTADRTVKVCEEAPLAIEVSGAGGYGVTYPWSIEKVVDEPRTVEVDAATGKATFDYRVTVTAGEAQPAGWTLSGEIVVDNPNTYAAGAITLTGASVTTDLGGGAVCTPTLPGDPTVAPEGELVVPFECTFTGEPDTSGSLSAEVTWDPQGPAGSASATDSGDVTLALGQETDKVVDVWDDKTDPENPVLLEEDLTWSEGLVKTYDYSLTHEGVPGTCVDVTNTAWVDLTGEDPSASATATVCVEKPLEADVAGSADLARAYAWSVAKVADATQKTVDGAGNATFTYTVTAKAGASTDSGWQLTGSVEITNPNEYAAGDITADVTAATDLGGGSACTVTGGQDVVIGEDSSVTLPVACSFSSQPAGSGALTVTATWDPAGEATTASVSDSTPIAFTVRSETNKTVQVVDDKTVAGQRVVLDPALTWAPGLVKTYTYDLTVKGGAPGTCAGYTNTATIDLPVGTDPTATAAVLACTPPAEVLPEQTFGKAVGSVKASCQGTVRAKLSNRSGETVVYKLRVGKKVHRITVKSLAKKKFVTRGKARATVTLKVGSTRLDRIRIPQRCEAPEVLPDTGLRPTSS